jgi:hypothetical protein
MRVDSYEQAQTQHTNTPPPHRASKGTALAAYGEIAFSPVGVAIMFVSAVSESLRLVMTQYLLVGLKMGPIEGVWGGLGVWG